uniref:Uncharacterized protein n=1 Tax=Cacopsylla melanoneura TaxID=428564 RepID=A0A8D9BS63_9HEMI
MISVPFKWVKHEYFSQLITLYNWTTTPQFKVLFFSFLIIHYMERIVFVGGQQFGPPDIRYIRYLLNQILNLFLPTKEIIRRCSSTLTHSAPRVQYTGRCSRSVQYAVIF